MKAEGHQLDQDVEVLCETLNTDIEKGTSQCKKTEFHAPILFLVVNKNIKEHSTLSSGAWCTDVEGLTLALVTVALNAFMWEKRHSSYFWVPAHTPNFSRVLLPSRNMFVTFNHYSSSS